MVNQLEIRRQIEDELKANRRPARPRCARSTSSSPSIEFKLLEKSSTLSDDK